MAIASLPPGFRFHPTDIELVMYYLKRKVMGKKLRVEAISELNIYLFSPWDLPDKSCLKSKDREWYFFCLRERKYASGSRMNRATESGYWKTTGKDRTVSYNDRVVGMVKTLVFHEGNAPHGNRTDWILHEYRLEDKKLADIGVVQDSFVLCKVFKKSGIGPKNGSQYGAHFQEEEWDDVDVDVTPTLQSVAMSLPIHPLPETQNCSIAVAMASPGRGGGIPLMIETQQSQVQSSSNNGYHRIFQNYTIAADTVDPDRTFGLSLADVGGPFVNDQFNESDDIAHMLSAFFDADVLPPNNIQNLGSVNNEPACQLIGNDSFNGLQNFHGIDACGASQFPFDQSNILLQNVVVPFLEIADIDDSFVSAVESSGPEPSSGGGLYEPYRPFGPEPSIFTGMSNGDNPYNYQLGQSFAYDASFGPLPNVFDGLVHPLMFPHTAIGWYDMDITRGVGSGTEEEYNYGIEQAANRKYLRR